MDPLTNISEANAKSILLALCADDSQLTRRAENLLRKIDTLQQREMTASNQSGKKRKASSTIRICGQCQDSFYEEENNDKACRYHSGRCHGTPRGTVNFALGNIPLPYTPC